VKSSSEKAKGKRQKEWYQMECVFARNDGMPHQRFLHLPLENIHILNYIYRFGAFFWPFSFPGLPTVRLRFCFNPGLFDERPIGALQWPFRPWVLQ